MKPATIEAYNTLQTATDREICDALRRHIDAGLPGAESRIWHAHPVWFLAGNPITGYSRLKAGIRLMFWSGADFAEPRLRPGTGKFRDASAIYTEAGQIDAGDLARWLEKAARIQWNYRDLMRLGRLERIG
ncbi:MAG TPA: DUF1801 domain-containing protein [Paracoccaceae bacterium]|nr:DUF1801 domain-containing protein [Paracoccaceae bacterium]HMO72253.1 DUF1801 domain-containing protein [Paracoccaceae bacterium]